MQAMIFAAGLGTRLYPLTKDKPKALVELQGKSLLEHAILKLKKAGVNKFVINTHHFAEKIQYFLEEKNYFNTDISISFEEDLLETAGGLKAAEKYFRKDESVVLYNADIVSNININKLSNEFNPENEIAKLAVRKRESDRVLLFDDKMHLCGWRNNKTSEELISFKSEVQNPYAFSGIHIVSFKILKYLEPKKLSLTPFYINLAKQEKISAFDHSNDYWFDCGKPETLKQAEKFLNSIS